MVLSYQLLEHLTSAKEGTEMLYMPTLTTPKPTLDISNKSQHSYLIHPETTPGSCSAKSSRQKIQIGGGIILGCTLWLPLPHHLFPHKWHRVWLQSSTFHWNCSIKNLYQLPSHQFRSPSDLIPRSLPTGNPCFLLYEPSVLLSPLSSVFKLCLHFLPTVSDPFFTVSILVQVLLMEPPSQKS